MEQRLVPELRFPEFEGEWEEKKGKFIFETISIKNKGHLDVLSATQDKGVVYRKDLDMKIQYDKANLTNYKKVSKTDFIISLRSFQGGIECSDIEGIMSPAYTIFNFKYKELYSTDFFRVMFKSGDFIRKLNTLTYGVRDGKSISYRDFSSLNFKIPSFQEQQKIGCFFYKIDKKLELQQEKIDNLKKYKKGMMQRIFSQEIRFKDDNGNDYPEWEEKKLGEIALNSSYGMNVAAKSYDGKNKYIRITDINDESNNYNYDDLVSPNGELEERFLLLEGDILFARTGASVGKTYYYKKEDGIVYYAGYLIRFKIKKEYNYKFIFYNTLTDKYNNWVKIMSMRSGQPGINAKEYSNWNILIPSLPEQIKIANFLSSIDKKIELEEEKLEEYRKLKKGLMQRMFI